MHFINYCSERVTVVKYRLQESGQLTELHTQSPDSSLSKVSALSKQSAACGTLVSYLFSCSLVDWAPRSACTEASLLGMLLMLGILSHLVVHVDLEALVDFLPLVIER